MPSRLMSPVTVDVTAVRTTPRAAAMFTSPAVRQAASACSRNSTGVGPVVGAGEHRRVVGREREASVSADLLSGAVVAVDSRRAVGSADPGVAGLELEVGQSPVGRDGVEGGEQRRGV